MERGSDKHGPMMDDALKHETEGLIRAGRDTHAQEWKSAEPNGEDQPDVDRVPGGTAIGGVPDGMTERDVEGRSELARFLGRAFPAVAQQLVERAMANEAPAGVLAQLRRLPSGREYGNVQEVWEALGGGGEAHRA